MGILRRVGPSRQIGYEFNNIFVYFPFEGLGFPDV